MNWQDASPSEILADVEAMAAALQATGVTPSTLGMSTAAATEWVKATVADPYERARQLFNLKHS